jgi:hypothetical protein
MRQRVEEYRRLGVDARLGTLDRRAFLKNAGALGIGASAALSVWGRPPLLEEAAAATINVYPGQDLARAINGRGPGNVYKLGGSLTNPAVYRLSATVKAPDNTTVLGGPISRNSAGHVDKTASIVSGGNGVEIAFGGQARGLTISQVTITGPAPDPYANPSNGRQMLDCGIQQQTGLALTRSKLQHCFVACLGSNSGFAKDCNFRASGYFFIDVPNGDKAALIKIAGWAWKFDLFDSWLHEAPRQMMWYDIDVQEGTVEGNLIDGNFPLHSTKHGISPDSQMGVLFEISNGPFVCRGNVIRNTGLQAVAVRGSADIDIAGNVFRNNHTRARGVQALHVQEDPRYPNKGYRVHDVRVHGNNFNGQALRNENPRSITIGGQYSSADVHLWNNSHFRGVI